MILQLGALFGSAISGLGSVLGQAFQAAAPTLLDVGNQFLVRELTRKQRNANQRALKGQAVQVLNTPGISVARVGGTPQPVGGRVQRSTFTPAAFTPAQSPLGNIPLLPVGVRGPPGGLQPFGIPFGFGFPQGSSFPVGTAQNPRGGFAMAAQLPAVISPQRVPQIGPKFATDERGKTIHFVPAPNGNGFIPVVQARGLGLGATKPWWRFNRFTGNYEKIKGRRMNPFNFRAAKRAGRRVEATLDAVKELVRIEKKMTSGKVRFKKRKKR